MDPGPILDMISVIGGAGGSPPRCRRRYLWAQNLITMRSGEGRMRSAEGEVVELAVERLGAGGDGVASWRGEPVFVPFTVPGDRVRTRLGRRRGAGYEGRVIELIAPGSGRVPPPCRHFGHCGGCALQHLDRDLYRRTKLAGLTNALDRVGIDSGAIEELRGGGAGPAPGASGSPPAA